MAGKKGRSGGPRRGSGRKAGWRKPETRAMLAELDRYRDLEAEDVLPSAFLKRVMLDESAPLPARIMCAAKIIPFVERRQPPPPPDQIPPMRLWSDAQLDISSGQRWRTCGPIPLPTAASFSNGWASRGRTPGQG
jgi:hypothetical protein